MTEIKTTAIPRRQECINKEHPFTSGAKDIFDDTLEKPQSEVNQDRIGDVELLQGEINALDSQNYVYAATYSALPATGSKDTIYRVSSWDGTQVDATKYAEYAWDGSDYQLLSVKSQVGEVFDISEYKATGGTLATFADLSAALGTNGENVPVGVRHGGMSVKYVHNSDNKYVQYRLMSDTFSTTKRDWQGVDAEPTAGSVDLVQSGGVYASILEIKSEIGLNETVTLTTDDEVALGVSAGVVTTPASSAWTGLVIPVESGVTYNFGAPYDSGTGKGWASIYSCTRYPQIGDSVTILTAEQATSFTPSETQLYILIVIRVSSLPYDYTLYAAGIKKDIEDIETDLSDFEDETSGKLDSIENTMGEPTVIKVVTSSDYANKIWGGASGVIASTAAMNGYIVHFVKGRKYIINGTIVSCVLFNHVPSIGDTDSQGTVSAETDYTPNQDYYGLITFRVENTISVKKYAMAMYKDVEETEKRTSINDENIKRGYEFVGSYDNIAWGGASGVIASTSALNGFVIYIPNGQTELYLNGVSSILSCASFTHKPVIGDTDVVGGESFIISGNRIKCIFPSNANGLWILITVRISEVDITNITYSLSNYAYDAVVSGLSGKRILCLGDSITEFVQSDGRNYPKYLSMLSGATVYGCGVGGARLSQRADIDPTTIGGSYAALDIVSLTDAIADGDFTDAIAAAQYLKDHASDDNTAQINVLSNVDFDSLDWIIVMGGTNDWTSDVPIGQDTDAGDYTTIKGALRKIVRNLCTRCPNARILLMAEPPRYFQERNRAHFCDVWENGQGNTLTDVINAIIESAGFSHVPIVDLYRKLGWNEFNWDTYYKYQATGIVDLTHPYSGLRYIAEMAMKYIKNCYY